MISVVTYKWKPATAYRSTFGPETVSTLAAMVARHYRKRHRFICVTDDPAGIAPGIEIVPLWPDHGQMINPHGPSNPSCYRRLKMFSAEAEAMFGKRFVSIDLDCVITGDLSPLWDRPEEFVAWGDTNPTTHYNGSMILMTAGARRKVWDDFNPERSPKVAMRAGHFGSDQAWISYCLGPGEATWSVMDGVYSYRLHLARAPDLPTNARVVFFHGRTDPWGPGMARVPWIREHYRASPPAERRAKVEAVNVASRLALLSDGRSVPITDLFDARGENTDDASAAISFAAGSGGDWFSGAVADFKPVLAQ